MKRSKLLFSSILVSLLGVGVFSGLRAADFVNPVLKVSADSSREFYLAVSGTSALSGGNKIKAKGNVGDGNTWIENSTAMTLQGTCSIGGSTKLLFKGNYTERHGGLNGLVFNIYDGDSFKREIQIWTNGDWKTNSELAGKVIVYNGNYNYTIQGNVPATSSKTSTYYFVPHAVWNTVGTETFKMSCLFDQFEVDYVSGTKLTSFNGSAIWRFTYSGKTALNYVVFNRLSDTGTWWNKSGYIGVDGSYVSGSAKDIYVMPYGESAYDNFTSGTWQTNPKKVELTSDQSPSSSTGRVFFNNSGTHWADNSGENKGCAVYAWGGSASPILFGSRTAEATIYNFKWFNDDNGTSYGYADIPTDITGYKICRITAVDDYGTGTGYFSDNEFLADSFAYVRYGRTEGNYIDSDGVKGDAGANLMKKVIEAYDTCSSSVLNGYGAYNALNTNFYSHATAAAKSATQQSLNGQTTTIQKHFEGMGSRTSGNGINSGRFLFLGNSKNDSTSIIFIIIVGTLSLAAVGGYFLLRKKKED